MHRIPRGAKEVANFARRMVFTLGLPNNSSKPGWEEMGLLDLRLKLEEEYRELIEELDWVLAHPDSTAKPIINESVDLANICMMITDNLGGLDD